MSPVVSDSEEQGWEELIDAAMTHLLRTVLAKNKKESASVPQPLAVPKDTSKLVKHIALVFDRIMKGAKIVVPTQEKKDTDKKKKK